MIGTSEAVSIIISKIIAAKRKEKKTHKMYLDMLIRQFRKFWENIL